MENGRLQRRDDSDSVTLWLVIPQKLTKKAAHAIWTALDHDPEETYCHHDYDCCGCWYHQELQVVTTSTRTLLKQYHYCNI